MFSVRRSYVLIATALLSLAALTVGGVAGAASPRHAVTAWVTLPQLPDAPPGRFNLRVAGDRLAAALQDSASWQAAGLDVARDVTVKRLAESPVVAVTVRGQQPQRLSAAVEAVGRTAIRAVSEGQAQQAVAREAAAREEYRRTRQQLDAAVLQAGVSDPARVADGYDRDVGKVKAEGVIVNGQAPLTPAGRQAAVTLYRGAQAELRAVSAPLSARRVSSQAAADRWELAVAERQDAEALAAAITATGTVRLVANTTDSLPRLVAGGALLASAALLAGVGLVSASGAYPRRRARSMAYASPWVPR
ncbi:MAG: hypothetical protein M3387_07000 [Actinomycetota bacterium]|nr:hypothetical protein [Actinomycetota bacterium]